MLADSLGRPLRFALTPGQTHDMREAESRVVQGGKA
jgi:transposase